MDKEKKEIIVQAQNTPAEMIRMAVAGGADLEKLRGLLELQKEYEANQARKAYHLAMSKFKKNPPKIDKDKKVSFGNTKYSHASLANVVEKITIALSGHGLSISWGNKQTESQICVTCKVTHVLGHSEETTLCGPADNSGSKNSIQAIGSTISYLQRYSALSLLGLATDDQDNDARGDEALITNAQLHTIRDTLISQEKSESNLVKYMAVDKLEDIKAVDYQKAINAINSARKAQK
jgi:hypothetical protein